MAQVKAKCGNCREIVLVDDCKEANVCPTCGEAFITEKAIYRYNQNADKPNQDHLKKQKHVLKSLGRGLLMTLECVGYLLYVIFFIWLFVDITDGLKKK